jgi:hypothetical protein
MEKESTNNNNRLRCTGRTRGSMCGSQYEKIRCSC